MMYTQVIRIPYFESGLTADDSMRVEAITSDFNVSINDFALTKADVFNIVSSESEKQSYVDKALMLAPFENIEEEYLFAQLNSLLRTDVHNQVLPLKGTNGLNASPYCKYWFGVWHLLALHKLTSISFNTDPHSRQLITQCKYIADTTLAMCMSTKTSESMFIGSIITRLNDGDRYRVIYVDRDMAEELSDQEVINAFQEI